MKRPAPITVACVLAYGLAAFMAYATALQVPVAIRLSQEGWIKQPGAPLAILLCFVAALLGLLFALGALRLWRRGDPSLILVPLVLVALYGVQGLLRYDGATTRDLLALLSPLALTLLFSGLCLTPTARKWIGTRAGTKEGSVQAEQPPL